MELIRGDNHVISATNGLVVCEVWSRPELSADDGARNARDMVTFLTEKALRVGSPYVGMLFDLRRGPPVFGPKTRAALLDLFTQAARASIPVGVLTGNSPTQLVQFKNVCREASGRAAVFDDEAAALRWLRAPAAGGSGR